jgi:hypothetical protein
MSHTPGPWFVKEVPGIGTGIFGWRGTLAVPVAQVHSPFADVQEANARLIAAACNSYDKHCGKRAIECAEGDLLGELLTACEAVLTWWGRVYPPDIFDGSSGNENTLEIVRIRDVVCAALARARAEGSEEVER